MTFGIAKRVRNAFSAARGVIVALTLSVLLVACGSTAAVEPPPVSTTTTTLVQQGNVNYAAPSLPTNFNPNTPAGDTSSTRQVMSLVWPSAFYQNSSYRDVVNTDLLSSAELVSTSPQTIVYKINPKAHWSDGTPITATDFIYNWKAQSGQATTADVGGKAFLANSHVGYSSIKSITGSHGGKTVTVVFGRYFSEWEMLFSFLVPAHLAQVVGWNSGFAQPGPSLEVSGGPYSIGRYVAGKSLELVMNKSYWGRAPSIPSITFLSDPNPSSYPNQFQQGMINLAQTPGHDLLYSALKGIVGLQTDLVPSLTTQKLVFNLNNPTLSNLKVRKAIALAIDRKTIAYDAIGSYVPGVSPAGNNIFSPGTPQYQNDAGSYEKSNPSAAVAMLSSAGYTRLTNGKFEKNGKPLAITISTDVNNQQLLLVEQVITFELASIGFSVSYANDPLGALVSTVLPQGAFDVALIGQPGSPNASFDVSSYSSSEIGRANITGYNSAKADALISKASSELDPGTSASVYNQLDKLIWQDLPTIPLYSVPNVLAFNSGYTFIGQSSRRSTIFWNANRWTFAPTK